jgi:hypothetical protein
MTYQTINSATGEQNRLAALVTLEMGKLIAGARGPFQPDGGF